MIDALQRSISYLRISVTDRCNLRCRYCMPEEGVQPMRHDQLLSYEQIARLVRVFARLGIRKVRLTGGEPLVRRDLYRLVAAVKAVPGIQTVALTTNGLLLSEQLPGLLAAGLDSVNVSLDTVDEALFERLTRRPGAGRVMAAIREAAAVPGLRVKLNCVPTPQNQEGLPELIAFAGGLGLPLRFIELMPFGEGMGQERLSEDRLRDFIAGRLGALTPLDPGLARDKCRYFELPGGAVIGFISAVSHRFCDFCDRIRLTADGHLRTCLQYEDGLWLKPLLGRSDEELMATITRTVLSKPSGHHFGQPGMAEEKTPRMSQIGG